MRLVSNWRAVLRHAWSIRLNIAATLLGAVEIGLSVFIDNPPMPRGTFAALAMAVTIAAAAARFAAQRPVSGDD